MRIASSPPRSSGSGHRGGRAAPPPYPAARPAPSHRRLARLVRVVVATATLGSVLGVAVLSTVGVAPAAAGTASGWTAATLPVPMGPTLGPTPGVSCSTTTNCVAVGDAETGPTSGSGVPIAETLSGGTWAVANLPLPTGQTAAFPTGVSCTTATDCVAVGVTAISASLYTGIPAAWTLSGTAWTVATLPLPSGQTAVNINGVSCASTTSCVAVGNTPGAAGGIPLAWTLSGGTWTATVLPPSATGYFVNGVSCATSTNCVAVGDGSNSEAWTLSGGAWTAAIISSAAWTGVSCTAATSCVAVGYAGGNGSAYYPIAETLSGTAWTTTALPLPSGDSGGAFPNGVSCTSFTNCAAVGYVKGSTGETPVAWTLSSTAWTVATLPLPTERTETILNGVSCTTATTCVAVGNNNALGVPIAETLSGTAWAVAVLPMPMELERVHLTGVSCTTATTCVTVGNAGLNSDYFLPIVETLSGATWTAAALPLPSGQAYADITGVSCATATSCVAVGYTGYGIGNSHPSTTPIAWILSDATWTAANLSPPTGQASVALFGVSCAATTSCTAVGTANAGPSTATVPITETLSGATWTGTVLPAPSGETPITLTGVSCVTATNCVAVGDLPAYTPYVWTLSGITWTYTALSGYASPTGVSCTTATNCVAVGPDGFTARGLGGSSDVWTLSGATWAYAALPLPSGSAGGADLAGVSCTTSINCAAAGYDNYATPYAEVLSGTTWTAAAPPVPSGHTDAGIFGISCAAVDTCVAVGTTGPVGTGATSNVPTAWTLSPPPPCSPVPGDNCVFSQAMPFAQFAAPVGQATQTIADIVTNVTSAPETINSVGIDNASNMANNDTTDSTSVGIPGTAWPLSSTTEFIIPPGDTCSGTTLQPGQSCNIPIAFHPTAAGSNTNFLCLNAVAGSSIGDCIYLQGTTTATSTVTLPAGCVESSTTNCPKLGSGVQVIPTFDATQGNISPAAYNFGIEAQSLDFVPSSTTPGTTTNQSVTITNSSQSATTPFALGLDQGGYSPGQYAVTATSCPTSGSGAYPYAPLAVGASCTAQVTWTVPPSGTPYLSGALTVESNVAAGPSSGSAYGGVMLLADNQVGPCTATTCKQPRLTPSFTVTPSHTQALGTATTCTATTCTFGLGPSAYGGTASDTLSFNWSWSGTDAAGKTIAGSATTTGTCDSACASATSPVAIPAGDTTITLPESAVSASGTPVPYQVNLFVEDTTTPATTVAPVHFQDVTVLPAGSSVPTPPVTSCPTGYLSITDHSGSGQSASVGTAFANPVTAQVTCVASGTPVPVSGATVTFTPPQTGASGTPSPTTATTSSTGLAQSTVTANKVVGAWKMSATVTVGSTSTPTTGTTPTITTVATQQMATPGTALTDSVTLTGYPSGYSGTLYSILLGPAAPVSGSCQGIAWSSGLQSGSIKEAGVVTQPVTGNGTYTSAPTSPTPTGCYGWAAETTPDATPSTSTVVMFPTYPETTLVVSTLPTPVPTAPTTWALTNTAITTPTTTTVACSPNPAVLDATVTCTSTTVVTSTAKPVTSGTVVDSSQGKTLCAAATVSSKGGATCKTAALPVGSDSVTASYGGTSTDAPSTGSTKVVVGKKKVCTIPGGGPGCPPLPALPSTTALVINPTTVYTSLPGGTTRTVTLTATVTVAGIGGAVTNGMVAFTVTGSGRGTAPVSSAPITVGEGAVGPSGVVAITVAAGSVKAPIGTDAVVATYLPGGYALSSSPPATLVVHRVPTTTTIALGVPLLMPGASTGITVTVIDALDRKPVPGGEVNLAAAGQPTETIGLGPHGNGHLSLHAPTHPGGHWGWFASSTPSPIPGMPGTGTGVGHVSGPTPFTIAANFPGSTDYAPSSATAEATAAKLPTTTTLGASPSASTDGQAVTLSATVTSQGSPVASGTVTFTGPSSTGPGSTVLCSDAALGSSGIATCATSSLPVGSDAVTAAYSGTTTYDPSSATTTVTVAKVPTTTTVTCSPNPTLHGTAVTCVTTVTAATGPTPTGTVSVTTPGGPIGMCPLANGSCSVATSTLPTGTTTITAGYPGSSTDAPSVGTTTTTVTTPPPPGGGCTTNCGGSTPPGGGCTTNCGGTTPPGGGCTTNCGGSTPPGGGPPTGTGTIPTPPTTTTPVPKPTTPTPTPTPVTPTIVWTCHSRHCQPTGHSGPHPTYRPCPKGDVCVVPTTTTVTCTPASMVAAHTHPVHCVAVVRTSTGAIPPGGVIRFVVNGSSHRFGPWSLDARGDKRAPVFQPVHSGGHAVDAFYSGVKYGLVDYLASDGTTAVSVDLLVCPVPSTKISTGRWLVTALPWWLFIAVLLLIAYGLLLRKRPLHEQVEKDEATTDFDPNDEKEFS